MSDTVQFLLMAPVFIGVALACVIYGRRLMPHAGMSPLDRLVLDAVERFGPDANVWQISGYVYARREQWPFGGGFGPIYASLLRLERDREITRDWQMPSSGRLVPPACRLYSRVGQS